MAEPFKNLFNETLIDNVAASLRKHWPDFDAIAFKTSVFDAHWQQRELKDRIYHIATSMQPLLPSDYAQAVAILQLAGAAFSGVEYLIFPAYVELFGLDDYEPSVKALEVMTPYSSSELAVRPFIIRYGDRMMTQMERWAESENEHVRRLASEGCRPRLPWAMALPEFKRDPGAVLNLIEKLMDDLKEMGVETEGLTDEKQQRIYELAKQNYSISEIARMLNMGQEEVKFILDFRTKTEDGTISLR